MLNLDLLALLSILSLSICLIAILGGYLRLQRKLRRLEQEEEEIKHKARLKASKILEHAQEAAFQIANEAVLKAEESKHLVKEKLAEVAEKQLKEYQSMLKDSSTDIEKETIKILELKMDEEWAKLQKELEKYRIQKTDEINKKATEAVKRLSKEVIGKSIDVNTHSILLNEALESAKKEYGL